MGLLTALFSRKVPAIRPQAAYRRLQEDKRVIIVDVRQPVETLTSRASTRLQCINTVGRSERGRSIGDFMGLFVRFFAHLSRRGASQPAV